MIYKLNEKEESELESLTKDLFGDCPPTMTTPDMDEHKKERYVTLAEKKIELMKATLN